MLKKLFVKKDGSMDTIMIVIIIAFLITLLFAISHEFLMYVTILQDKHLTEAELDALHNREVLFGVTIVSELIGGFVYSGVKAITHKEED